MYVSMYVLWLLLFGAGIAINSHKVTSQWI